MTLMNVIVDIVDCKNNYINKKIRYVQKETNTEAATTG